MKKWFMTGSLALMALGIAACGSDNEEGSADGDNGSEDDAAVEETGELVVYSSRNETFVNELLAKFEEDTGIEVQAFHGDDNAINRLKTEAEAGNISADIFISNDVGALEHLKMEGLLQESDPENIESIDENYRADDNSWFALSARTRVLMYNKDLISEDEMPQNIWDLTDEQYADEFAITRGGNGGMIGHVSALRQEWGDEKTSEWLEAISENAGTILEGHGDIRRAVGSGEFKFGLVNNYYYHQQLQEPTDNNVGVIYPDQGDDEMGAVVNAAGIGYIADNPNQHSAEVFLDWILENENQREFSYNSLEVPINPEVEAVEGAASIDDYKTHDMPLSQLGEVWEDTRTLIEQSGLDLEIR
ncbi:extracellular solute-binding protein [Alteribacter keqinensis]|uniref:Extracellular solute-binding protein n=1 Tax=Alteribacter keqinensis TaxID=2483800 RepID=A0A3M7TLF8_9BACI|nr:extracellular solute-binding protein [Alteribacter keqinensis]RNA66308.1 extracellular solute-binding protein [Alteribacter keqinensis]